MRGVAGAVAALALARSRRQGKSSRRILLQELPDLQGDEPGAIAGRPTERCDSFWRSFTRETVQTELAGHAAQHLLQQSLKVYLTVIYIKEILC